MCGRFTRKYTWKQVHEFLNLVFPAGVLPARGELKASYNVAPGQEILALRETDGQPPASGLEFVWLRWGFVPAWSKDPRRYWINARSETAAELPAFREAFARRRCVIPASGFYEWRVLPGAKQPEFISVVGAEIMCFAGIWELHREGGEDVATCAIMTTRPNDFMGRVHDRMPVILSPEDAKLWIGGRDLARLTEPSLLQLQSHAVSPRVNGVKTDEPSLMEPWTPDVPPSLFG
jgi:putative SOS response-associated peptidase YedK